jgi:hypothetical protein
MYFNKPGVHLQCQIWKLAREAHAVGVPLNVTCWQRRRADLSSPGHVPLRLVHAHGGEWRRARKTDRPSSSPQAAMHPPRGCGGGATSHGFMEV